MMQSIEYSEKRPGFDGETYCEYDGTKDSFKQAWERANDNLKPYDFRYIDTIMEATTQMFDDLELSKVLSFHLKLNEKTLMVLENSFHFNMSYENGNNSHQPKYVILRMENLIKKVKDMITETSSPTPTTADESNDTPVISGREINNQPEQELNPTILVVVMFLLLFLIGLF